MQDELVVAPIPQRPRSPVEAKRPRVLVVDDHDVWRSVICSTLGQQSQLCIVGEAADGSEAIQKIQDLLPDLIVLDIALPKLNGLEVAYRIRELSPRSKVLIVSETRTAEVAEEAFRRGALGYVVKSGAATELLQATEAVLQGKQFISTHLIGSAFGDRRERLSTSPRNENVITASPLRNSSKASRHEVEFYPEDEAYVAGLARYVETVLRRGDPAIVIVTVSHRASLVQRLKNGGADVDALIECGRVVLLDAFETLSTIMVDDKPDSARCEQALSALISGAPRNTPGMYPHVAFCGQCAPVLLRQGNTEGAIQLEHLWDEITLAYGADTLCGYIWSEFPHKDRQEIVQKICAEHAMVYGLESGY